MLKCIFFAKAAKTARFFAIVVMNFSMMCSNCTKAPVQTAVAEPYVQSTVEEAVAEPYVQSTVEEAVAEPVVQEKVADEEDLCNSEGINFPENDVQNDVEKALEKTLSSDEEDLPISERVDDPTEDTESESEPVEVKEVDGKIVPVDELNKVPDTDDNQEVLSEVGPSALFDENGNIINLDEEDLCSSEGINYPENDKEYDDGMDAIGESHEEYLDDPTQDTESESNPVEVKEVDGKIVPADELIKVPDTDDDKEDLPISERVDDPTEDTESESEPVEVKEVNGEIVEA